MQEEVFQKRKRERGEKLFTVQNSFDVNLDLKIKKEIEQNKNKRRVKRN